MRAASGRADRAQRRRLPLLTRLRYFLRIWRWYLVVRLGVYRRPLPDFVAALSTVPRPGGSHLSPRRLGLMVYRDLSVAGRHDVCLVNALVLYRLLREQGDDPEVVIGLPAEATDREAHAWIEVGGRDVGPPPGKGTHLPMARFS